MSFAELWRELEPLGRDPGTGGYRRYSWTQADAEGRAWFTRQAEKLGLAVEPVVSALAAVEELKAKDFNPERPVVLAVFTEEEGARFRVPCLGSRLMTGAIDPDADPADCEAGVHALALVIADLAGRAGRR